MLSEDVLIEAFQKDQARKYLRGARVASILGIASFISFSLADFYLTSHGYTWLQMASVRAVIVGTLLTLFTLT